MNILLVIQIKFINLKSKGMFIIFLVKKKFNE